MLKIRCTIGVLATLCIAQGQVKSSGNRATLQQQIEQTKIQRAANQRLMLDAASEAADAFAEFATSQGEVSSGESLKRLVEIRDEIKAAARNNDAIGTANLAVE